MVGKKLEIDGIYVEKDMLKVHLVQGHLINMLMLC